MRELLVVLNTRAQSFFRRSFELRWQTVVQNTASFLIFGGFTVTVFFVSRFATEYLITQAHIGLFLFHRFLSMLLYMFFVTVNIGNLIVSFGTLYRSQEVAFLMSLPISHAKIFLIKFVDNFFYSSSTLTMLGLAMLLGYGSHFELPWYFYFVVIFFVMLPFMLIAGVLATTSLMVLIKLGARIGFRWLLGLLIVAYGITVYTYFHLTNPMAMADEVLKMWPNVNEYMGYLDPPLVKALPNHWVAEFLYWSIQGDYARALPYLALLLFTMLGLIALAGLIARRFYYESWLAVTEWQALKPTETYREKGLLRPGESSLLSPQILVLARRDISLFFREPSQWLHLMLMFLLLVMFLVSVATMSFRFDEPVMQANAFLSVFLFTGFLIASIALRFVFPSISLEGDSFWLLRASPFAPQKLYWYKLLSAVAVVMVLGEALGISSVYMFSRDVELTIIAACVVFFVVLALVSANIAAGGYFASFKERNPIRIASSQGASLTFLGSMVYLMIVSATLIVPLNHYYKRVSYAGYSTPDWAMMPLILIGLFSAAIIAVSISVGLKSIQSDY